MANLHQNLARVLMICATSCFSTLMMTGCQVKVGYPQLDIVTTIDSESLEIPSEAELQQLVTSTLVDLNEGLQTEDFTRLHNNLASPFKHQASPEHLNRCFESLIQKKITMSEIDTDAVHFNVTPSIDHTGVLHLQGLCTVKPDAASFDLEYLHEGDGWKLVRISVRFWEVQQLPNRNESSAEAENHNTDRSYLL